MSDAGADERKGERAWRFAPPELALALALCAVAVILEAIAFLGSDPWIGGDLVGAGFLLVFVADVIVEPDGPAGRGIPALSSRWARGFVALLIGMALLVVRPSPLPPALIQGLAVLGASLSVFEGLLKAGTRRS